MYLVAPLIMLGGTESPAMSLGFWGMGGLKGTIGIRRKKKIFEGPLSGEIVIGPTCFLICRHVSVVGIGEVCM